MTFKTIFILSLLSLSLTEFLEPQVEAIEDAVQEPEILLGASNGAASTIVSCVKSKLGCKYVWGGNGPCAFDCSGLAKFCHAQAGISIERTASAQSQRGKGVSINNLQPGDLVFFNYGSGVAHVGTYIGGGQMIHSANENTGVIQSAVTSGYWRGVFNNARRYW